MADAEKSLAYEVDFEYTKGNRQIVGTGGNMPIRVIGYDGAAYRSQLLRHKKIEDGGGTSALADSVMADGTAAGVTVTGPQEKPEKYYPVVTLVLYLGYKKHWNKPLTLYDCFQIPDDLKPYGSSQKVGDRY